VTPDPLPELTEDEARVLGAFDFETVWRKIQAKLPAEERRCWKVIDQWGNTIKRYKTEHEALESAIHRNKRAEHFKVSMRYRIDRDQGLDEPKGCAEEISMLTHEQDEQLRDIAKRCEIDDVYMPPQRFELAQMANAILAIARQLEAEQERTDLE
jgi:hypothetical protein